MSDDKPVDSTLPDGENPDSERPPAADQPPPSDPPSSLDLELDDADVLDLLREALADSKARPSDGNILEGFQARIRDESKGRYFADGWATEQTPVSTFLVTSLVMLILVIISWLLLVPVDVREVTPGPASAPSTSSSADRR